MNDGLTGKGGFALAVIVWLAMAIVGTISGGADVPAGDAGICVPSPSEWNLHPVVSALCNMGLTLGTGVGFILLNRRLNFMPTASTAYATTFMLICGANAGAGCRLDTSVLLGVANMICMSMLMTARGLRNASASVFMAMTILSWGSMCQYAFVFFIPVYVFAVALLKMLRWKELCAALFGICAPYVIVLGFGIIKISDFHFPSINNIWMSGAPAADSSMLLIVAGVTALWALLLGLRNSISLFNANTATRAYNHLVTLPGIAVLLLMILDFGNIRAYLMTLAIAAACQIGYLYAFSRQRHLSPVPLLIVFVIYIAAFFVVL